MNKLDQREMIILYKQVFGSESGKLVLKHLQAQFPAIGRPMSKDANESFYREGQQSVMAAIDWNLSQSIDRLDELNKGDDE